MRLKQWRGGWRESAPGRGTLCGLRLAVGEQNGELMSGARMQLLRRGGGPPGEATAGEATQAEPEAVAIIHEQFEGRPGAIAKAEERPAHGVLGEVLSAERGERIHTFAEIDRLISEQDRQVWSELNHDWPRKAVQRASRRVVSVRGSVMSKREPSARSKTRR